MEMVLVVEDDDDLRAAICQVLGDDEIATVPAANGADALELLEAGLRPSLILLDLMMPVMNGWSFRQRQEADERFASIPVVVMTATPRLADAAIGAVDAVCKPVELDALLECVRKHLSPYELDGEFDGAAKTIPDGAVVAALEIAESGEN